MSRSSQILRTLICTLLITATATTALACLWDNDTLQMERLRFPGVLEIITGKFVRHSRAYYEWRIKDRLKKLEAQPDDPALIDDLAVGYDKVGQYDKGIALLEKTFAVNPDRYETLANLATLQFHAGRLDESKRHVERALEINPDAHFGREKYQLLLTEYVQQSELQEAGMMSTQDRYFNNETGFAKFVISARLRSEEERDRSNLDWKALARQRKDEISAATRGVLGMLHFADHESPILLEALGDLLIVGEREENATQLAARAYVRAAQRADDKAVADKFRKMARDVLTMHEDFGMHHKETDGDYLQKLDKQFAEELAEGKAWFAEIEENENRWIAENRDVDREFAAVYYTSLDSTIAAAEQQVKSEPTDFRRPVQGRMILGALGTFCVLPLTLVLAITAAVVYWNRRMRCVSPEASEPVKRAF
jgi:tetratricopeptide (TPR) repeat protein